MSVREISGKGRSLSGWKFCWQSMHAVHGLKCYIWCICVYMCVCVCLYLQNLNNIYKKNMIYFNSYDTSFNCIKLINEAKLKISRKKCW